MEDNDQKDEKMNEIIDGLRNGAGTPEMIGEVIAADRAADATVELPVGEEPAPTKAADLPAPRCPFCQVALFQENHSGVTTYNIQMGPERLRIFTCANCDCVLPIQVMMINTPLIAAPGPEGGRLIHR